MMKVPNIMKMSCLSLSGTLKKLEPQKRGFLKLHMHWHVQYRVCKCQLQLCLELLLLSQLDLIIHMMDFLLPSYKNVKWHSVNKMAKIMYMLYYYSMKPCQSQYRSSPSSNFWLQQVHEQHGILSYVPNPAGYQSCISYPYSPWLEQNGLHLWSSSCVWHM